MNASHLPVLLRTDAVSNLALGVVLVAFRDAVADGIGLESSVVMVVMAAGLIGNGIWLAVMARSVRPTPVRMSGVIDLAFVALMVILSLSDATEPWARLVCAALAATVTLMGIAKLAMARALDSRQAERRSVGVG